MDCHGQSAPCPPLPPLPFHFDDRTSGLGCLEDCRSTVTEAGAGGAPRGGGGGGSKLTYMYRLTSLPQTMHADMVEEAIAAGACLSLTFNCLFTAFP